MTDPDDAATAADLRNHLSKFAPDSPIAVKVGGVFDFLDPSGLDSGKRDLSGTTCIVFLDGDASSVQIQDQNQNPNQNQNQNQSHD